MIYIYIYDISELANRIEIGLQPTESNKFVENPTKWRYTRLLNQRIIKACWSLSKHCLILRTVGLLVNRCGCLLFGFIPFFLSFSSLSIANGSISCGFDSSHFDQTVANCKFAPLFAFNFNTKRIQWEKERNLRIKMKIFDMIDISLCGLMLIAHAGIRFINIGLF